MTEERKVMKAQNIQVLVNYCKGWLAFTGLRMKSTREF